jgi:hypothetical protein
VVTYENFASTFLAINNNAAMKMDIFQSPFFVQHRSLESSLCSSWTFIGLKNSSYERLVFQALFIIEVDVPGHSPADTLFSKNCLVIHKGTYFSSFHCKQLQASLDTADWMSNNHSQRKPSHWLR